MSKTINHPFKAGNGILTCEEAKALAHNKMIFGFGAVFLCCTSDIKTIAFGNY